MLKELLDQLLIKNRGKTIGLLIGFLFGLIVLIIGFWRAVFLAICMCIGYWLGGMSDKKERFISFLDKILPKGLND